MIRVGKAWEGTHYCGRKASYKPQFGEDFSILGNPYPLKNNNRDEVCDQYHAYFHKALCEDARFRQAVNTLADQYQQGQDIILGCFCAPKRCHCDTIKAYIEDLMV